MSSSAGDWCLIESDPGLFTELIHGLGVKGVQVEELWNLDDVSNMKPIHGMIFLFKWLPSAADQSVAKESADNQSSASDFVFFAKQVINNACASQAIINILANVHHEDVELGSTLTDLVNFTSGFDCHMRGLTLSNSDVIRQVHNSFSRQQIYDYDDKVSKSDSEDLYHFVAYVPVGGRVYELDGLKDAPVDLGIYSSDWLETVKPVIQKRMSSSSGDIHFNLMAIVSDRLKELERRLTQTVSPADIAEIKQQIQLEKDNRRKQKVENLRRKHNYLPFIVELLKVLADQNKLEELLEHAKRSRDDRQTKKRRVAND